jgi:hypothetical protein
VVCDVVLFNPQAGHLLVVEAKSGANLEPEQGRKLIALTPELLIIAGGITVPRPVPLHCEVLYACLADNADRICLGADEAGLRVPVLAVSRSDARLLRPQMAGPLLSAAFSSPAVWTHPIARIVPFDHESPAEAFDQPVRALRLAASENLRRPGMLWRSLFSSAVSVRVPPGMRVEVSNFSVLGGRDINLGGLFAPNAPVLHIRSFSIIGGVNVRESRKKRNRDVSN